jgi:hypothetical protein
MLLIGGKVYDYDFSDAPDLTNYPFQNDVKILDPDGLFIEIPINTYQNNPIYRLAAKLQLRLTKDRVFGDGKGIPKNSYPFWSSLHRRLSNSRNLLTLDCISNSFFKFLILCNFKKSHLLVIISHPKSL